MMSFELNVGSKGTSQVYPSHFQVLTPPSLLGVFLFFFDVVLCYQLVSDVQIIAFSHFIYSLETSST